MHGKRALIISTLLSSVTSSDGQSIPEPLMEINPFPVGLIWHEQIHKKQQVENL